MHPELFTFRLPAHTTPFRIGFIRSIVQIIYKVYEYIKKNMNISICHWIENKLLTVMIKYLEHER